MRAALLVAAAALRLRGVSRQPATVRFAGEHHVDTRHLEGRPPAGGWAPPWAGDQCLPFPNGCGHLLHMCGVLVYSEFNTTCTRYGYEVKYAFDECRNASVAHQPVGMLPEVTAFGDNRSEEPPAGGGNASGAALAPAEEPEEVAFSSCVAKKYPSTDCTDVCDDLTRASVPLGEVCEKSCAKVQACFSSCSMSAAYPTPVAACVGECMGPVEPDQHGTVPPVAPPDCRTPECEWWKQASATADSAYWHSKEALENAQNMMDATAVQRAMNAAKTTTPEPYTTPFPWDKLKRRLHDYGDNPFAAFSPATPLPAVIPTPLPSGEGPITDSNGKDRFWKPVEEELENLKNLTNHTKFNF